METVQYAHQNSNQTVETLSYYSKFTRINDGLDQKKLIISFIGQFFQKLMRQGGFIIASDQNEGFYFFFPAKV